MKRRALSFFLIVVLSCSTIAQTAYAQEIPAYDLQEEVVEEVAAEAAEETEIDVVESADETLAVAVGETLDESLQDEKQEEIVTEEKLISETDAEEVSEVVEDEETGANLEASEFVIYVDENDEARIMECKSTQAKVVIPNVIDGHTVTSIAPFAFEKQQGTLKEIVMPDTIKVVGGFAFRQCKLLEKVSLPKNLIELEQGAFYDCDALTSIFIPKTLESGYEAFEACSNLKTVTFEDGIEVIPFHILKDCYGLESVVLPDSVEIIQEKAFYNCGQLTAVTFPKNLTTIEDEAFMYCNALTEVSLPDTVITIGTHSFAWCGKLATVSLSHNLKKMGRGALEGCHSLLSIEIPKSLEETNAPFGQFSQLKKVTFEEGTTRIIPYMFGYDYGLEEVVMPDTITTIGEHAFEYCKKLSNITWSKNLETIDGCAFQFCPCLETVELGPNVKKVSYMAFENCTGLKMVSFENPDTELEGLCFEHCTSLESIVLPDNMREIPQYCFINCSALKNVTFGKNTEVICAGAFQGCGFTSLTIPEGIRSIDGWAFQDCDSLTKVVLPNTLDELGTSAFQDCDVLTEVSLGAGIRAISDGVFINCPKLDNVIVPRMVTRIYSGAFENCTGLKSISLPRDLIFISEEAFSNYEGLTIYGVKDTLAYEFAENHGINFELKTVPATSISLTKTSIAMAQGNFSQVKVWVFPLDCTDIVYWNNDTPDVLALDAENEILFAQYASGIAKVEVVAGKQYAKCDVTVGNPIREIRMEAFQFAINETETLQLKPAIYPEDAVKQKLAWSSLYPEIATVDENGVVTGLKEGRTILTAMAQDGSGVKATCTIIVNSKITLVAPTTKITLLDTGVKVSWNEVDNAEGYYVYRKEVGKTYTKIATVTGKRYFLDKTAEGGKNYYYAVKAFAGRETSTYISASIQLKLAVPTTVAKATTGGVAVTWNAVSGAEGYRIYRKEEGASYVKIATVKADEAASYTDTTAVGGKKYYYAVKAYAGSVSSTYVSANVIAIPATPTTKITHLDTGVKVSWNVIEGADEYYVYRKTVGGTYTKIATVKGKNYYLDKTAVAGKQYYYAVKASANGKVSGYKSVLTTVPKR